MAIGAQIQVEGEAKMECEEARRVVREVKDLILTGKSRSETFSIADLVEALKHVMSCPESECQHLNSDEFWEGVLLI